MLPLLAESPPTTISELTDALTRGLQEHGIGAREIAAEGAAFPAIDLLRIDLTEAQLTRDFRPPQPSGSSGLSIEIAQFELIGAPIYFEKAALELRFAAERVKSRMEMIDRSGCLALESAAGGMISVEVARETLEALLHTLAVEAAAKQGLEVKKTNLNFTQEGPGAVAFRAEVTAKVFVMSATLALTGRVAIDDQLQARISDLSLNGDGMVLKLAGSYARPYLDRLEGRVFPLLAFTPGGLQLRNIELTAAATLRVRADLKTAEAPVT